MRSIVDRLFKFNEYSIKTMELDKDGDIIFPFGEKQKYMVYELLYNLYPEKNQQKLRVVYISVKKILLENVNISFKEALSQVNSYGVKKFASTLDTSIEKLMEHDLKIDKELKYPVVNHIVRG